MAKRKRITKGEVIDALIYLREPYLMNLIEGYIKQLEVQIKNLKKKQGKKDGK